MGWSNCGEDDLGRPIGYSIEAICDFSGCEEVIDRGLSYVCGSMHGAGSVDRDGVSIYTCGRYFCTTHLSGDNVCPTCEKESNSEDKNDNR